MRKLAMLLAAVLTLNLAAPAAPAYAAPRITDAETEVAVNEEEQSGETTETEAVGTSVEESETAEKDTVSTEEASETMSTQEEETKEDSTSESTEETTTSEVFTEETLETEEESIEEDTVETETTEEVTLEEEAELVVASNEEVTGDVVMSLDAEANVSLSSSDSSVWLKYTAEKSGYYIFSGWTNENYGYFDFYRNGKETKCYENYLYVYNYESELKIYAEAGDILYFKAYQYSSQEVKFTAVISEIESVTPVKDENGVYSGTFGDYTLQATFIPGYTRIEYGFKLLPSGENELSGSYNLEYKWREISSSSNSYLDNYSDYITSGVFYGSSYKKNTTYTMDVILKDRSGNIICVFTGMTVTTKDTDKPAVITVKDITYSSATIFYEQIANNVYIYYGKKGTTQKDSLSSYEREYSLEPSTEYRIWVEDYDGNVVQEETFVTEDVDFDVTYEATAYSGMVLLDASISGYKGTRSDIYVWYSYTDDNGKYVDKNTYIDLYDENGDGEKEGTCRITISELLAETTYSFEMALADSYSGKRYLRETKSVTTLESDFTAEDVSLTLSRNAQNPTTMDYTVTIPEHKWEENVAIYYRVMGEDSWRHAVTPIISEGDTTYTGTITGLTEGWNYEVKAAFLHQGIYKVTSLQLGDELYHPLVTADVDAFEANVSYELPAEDVDSESQWSVKLLYKEKDWSYYSNMTGSIVLTEENEYKTAFNTSQYITLTPGAEYLFKWELYKNGQLCHNKFQTVTAEDVSAKIEIDKIAFNSVEYTVSLLSRKDNLSSSVYLYPRISKKDGAVVAESYVSFSNSNPEAQKLSNGSLDANTEYEITLYYNNKPVGETVTFTTSADDRTLTLENVTGMISQLAFSVALAGDAVEESQTVIHVYAREKGQKEWKHHNYAYVSYAGTVQISISSDIKEETTYEYAVGIGKSYSTTPEYLKQKFAGEVTTPKDDRELTVSKVEARLNAVDVNVKLTGNAAVGSNYILLYYRLKDSEDEWTRKYTTMEGAGETELSFTKLDENTEFEYVLGLGKRYDTPKDELKNSKTGTFRTLEDDRKLTIDSVDTYLHKAKATVSLSGKAAEGILNRIYFFWKEKGTDSWSYDYESLEEQGTVTVSTYSYLKENTDYEYVIGISNEWIGSVEELELTENGEFKTITDDRTLSVSVEPSMQSATFEVVVSGKAAEETWGYVKVFYKEAGSENEDYTTIYYDGPGTYEQTVWSFNGAALKEDTEYEYVIGYADDYDNSKEELKQVVNGSFKTLQDPRKLADVGCEAGYESARLSATVTNNTYNVYTYIHYFVRTKGTESWRKYTSYGGSNITIEGNTQISSLEQGTEYEYEVVVTDNYNVTSPDEILKETQKASGTFTTKTSEYKVNIVPNTAKCTYDKGYVNVTASGDNNDERLYVTLYVTDGVQTFAENVILSQMQEYKNTAIFTGLNSKTEYTVTKAVISVKEYGNTVAIEEVSEFDKPITFTTKDMVVPQTLELPVEELYLNAAGGGAYISEQTLNAKVTPVNAVKALNWESDNVEVATVSNGYIKAVGSGTAVITVSSVLNPELKDTCKVVVKDYVIGRETETGTTEFVSGSIEMYKGDVLKGYALYEKDAEGEYGKVDGMNVSVERSLVAEWTKEGLRATGAGASKVYFEANGVKAVLGINVINKERGFGLVGLDSTDAAYPAVCTGDGVYTIANKDGIAYTVLGEITPHSWFNAAAFNWTSSDTSIARVENGVISPVANGSVTITASPVADPSPYAQSEVSITVNVKDVPTQCENIPTVYAVTNTKDKMLLEDVAFPAEWGDGWSWRDPKTQLYTLPVHNDYYAFEASYTGDDLYPYEGLVNVYISKINNVFAYEEEADHNHVVMVGESDSIMLRIEPEYMGMLPTNYRYVFSSVDGLTITATDTMGGYRITAEKEGDYSLIPTIEFYETDESGTEMITCSVQGEKYAVKATKKAQADLIRITCEDEDIMITGEETGMMIKMNFTEEMKGKKFTLLADVEDKNGNALDTKLQWAITDKTVASVSYKKNTSHKAEITVKGTGHAILTVTACDDTARTTQLDMEIRDYKPRINKTQTKVNIAYDYMDYNGRSLAYANYGLIEIAGVYEDVIDDIRLVKKNGQPENNLELEEYYDSSNGVLQFIVAPKKAEIDTGVYDCKIEVTTRMSKEPYSYPMKVTVVEEAPKVSAKMASALNLFYLGKSGTIDFTIQGLHSGIQNVQWVDKASDATGFEVTSYVYWNSNKQKYYSYVYHDEVKVIDRKPVDPKIANGTLTVKLYGVRKPIEIKNFKIKYNYKKPTLEAKKATTSIAPVAGNRTAGFYIYDKLDKSYLYYSPSSTSTSSYYYYDLTYDNDYVDATPSSSYVNTIYYGTKEKETVTYTLDSYGWREPLTVKQTIKTVAPKASLTPSTITYNKAYKSSVSTYVYLGNVSSFATPAWLDLEVKGTNAKAKALVEDDIFDITRSDYAEAPIMITLNQTRLLDLDEANELKAGTYKFKVTPYYRNEDNGKKMKLNTLNLSVKVVDKPITVKVTPGGNLDITKTAYNMYSLWLRSDFKNLGQDYMVTGAKLKGEYSKYFKPVRYSESNHSPYNYYYLQIAEHGKVKAGRKYKLSIEYTLLAPNGDTFTVQSNTFTITPKQSAPKVSVYNNNQVFYAATDMSRMYQIGVSDYYNIQSVSGSLDCNKDGHPDIVLHDVYISGSYSDFNVEIIDKDAVVATKNGKTYQVPITVELVGRDGISKDSKVNIKVKVKR